jgi:flagellar hook-associated protein 2
MSATTSTSGSGLSLSGLASGMDWTSIINEMLTVQAAPETQMSTEETTDNSVKSAFQTIGTELTTLAGDATTLSNPSFFASRTTSISNSSVASATAASGTPLGTYTFNVTKMATDAVQVGSKAAGKLNSSNNVSNLTLSSAGFANAVTAGTFTVNGKTVTIATSDTLQSVFDQISSVTNGAVTGSYNSTTDEITLSSTSSPSSPITLGSDTDTSNFLQSAELYNNGTGSITSTSALGGVNLGNTLNQANLSTTISDGGSGDGEFKINGVAINFDASTDSVTDVLQKINDSNAGVTATYDSLNDSFELADTTPGNVGISLQDVTGNFLAATGLSSGTLQAGTNLQYSINGGGTLTSQSNTIDAGSSGLTGLSVTALGTGSTAITVASDTSTISSAINSFVTDYNAVQNFISSQTVTTTSSTGTVTPGLLTGNMDAEGIETTLRQLVNASSGTTPGVESLNDLGIASNGQDNTLAVTSSTLTSVLTTNLAAVQKLFSDSSSGIAVTLNSYLGSSTSTTGMLSSGGMLATDENNMTNEANGLATSITNLQAQIAANKTMLTNEFTNMETAINSINTEKEYLNDYFDTSSSASSESAPTAAGSSSTSSSSSSSS